jgi:hypothetical protein
MLIFVANFISMELYEISGTAETATQVSDYTTERGKPIPSFNHGTIQANLIMLLGALYKKTLQDCLRT